MTLELGSAFVSVHRVLSGKHGASKYFHAAADGADLSLDVTLELTPDAFLARLIECLAPGCAVGPVVDVAVTTLGSLVARSSRQADRGWHVLLSHQQRERGLEGEGIGHAQTAGLRAAASPSCAAPRARRSPPRPRLVQESS